MLLLGQSSTPRSPDDTGWGSVVADGKLVEQTTNLRAVIVNSGPEPVDLLGVEGHGFQEAEGYQVVLSHRRDQPRIVPGTAATIDLEATVRCLGNVSIRTDMRASLRLRTANGAEHAMDIALDAGPWTSELQAVLDACDVPPLR